MSVGSDDKDIIGQILDVADTYHDMANLPSNFNIKIKEAGRCQIDEKETNLSFLQENIASYEDLCKNTEYKDISDVLLQNKGDEIRVQIKSEYASFISYEDWVLDVFGKHKELFKDNVELFNVPVEQVTFFDGEPKFMLDSISNDEFYKMFMTQGRYLETIASKWDQAPKKGSPLYVNIDTFKPCGQTGNYIRFENEYVTFYNQSEQVGKLSQHCLQFLKIGVRNLCKTLVDLKGAENIREIVRENLVLTGKCSKLSSSSSSGMKRPGGPSQAETSSCAKRAKKGGTIAINEDFIVDQLANFIVSGGVENILNIKRSGDYGQIGAVHAYNDKHVAENQRCYLVTFDRLCFLRARFEHVPCVRVYQNGTIDISHGIINDDVLITSAYVSTLNKLNAAYGAYDAIKQTYDEAKHNVEEPDETLPKDITENAFISGLLEFTDKTRKDSVDHAHPLLKEVFKDEKMYNDSRYPLIYLIDYTYKRVKELSHQVNTEIYTSLITLIRKIRMLHGTEIQKIDIPSEPPIHSIDKMKELILSMSNSTNTHNFLSNIRSIDKAELTTLESRLKEQFENGSYTFLVKDSENKDTEITISDTPDITSMVVDQKLIQLMGDSLFKGGHVKQIMEGASAHFVSDIEKLVKVKNKNVKPMSPLLVFYQILSNMIVLKSARVQSRRNANLHMLANVIEDTFTDAIERIREDRESLVEVWDKFLSDANGQSGQSRGGQLGGGPDSPYPSSHPSSHLSGTASPLSRTPSASSTTPAPIYPDTPPMSDFANNEGYNKEKIYGEGVKRSLQFDESPPNHDEKTEIRDLTVFIERTPEECFYNAANALEQIDGIAMVDSDKYDVMLVKVALFDFVKLPCFEGLSTFADGVFKKHDGGSDVFDIGPVNQGAEKLRYEYFLAPLIKDPEHPEIIEMPNQLTHEYIWALTEHRYNLLMDLYDIQQKGSPSSNPDPMQKGGSAPSFSARPLPRGVSFKPDRAQGYYRSTEEVREMLEALSFRRRSRFF